MKRAILLRASAFWLAPAIAGLFHSPVVADWVASGVFKYQDREWNETGFTGTILEQPIRFADVEVVDANQKGTKAILAKGRTDATGAFRISVRDSGTRTVYVRALTSTTQTPDLFVKVVDPAKGKVYALASPQQAGHAPTQDVNFGVLVAAVGSGGEAFNILDMGIYGADYIRDLTGSRPGSQKLLTFRWARGAGIGSSSTSGNTVTLRDTAGYDDTVILHEWGHYAMNNYSKSSNPGGSHFLADCNQDLRLAFDEGRASYLGCSVRRANGMSVANVYVRTDGGSGIGRATNWFDLESETQYACDGDTSEVTVARSLWDIVDGAATQDFTSGSDEPHDTLALPDLEVWEVFAGPVKQATTVTHESFWDGWFDPTILNGNLPAMKDIFGALSIEFFPDGLEPNESATPAAPLLLPNGAPVHLTYFSDPEGDGAGAPDTDVFRLEASAGASYTIETLNLLSEADTLLEVLNTDGVTVLASNDDRAAGDPSSSVVWSAPRTDTFYVRSTRVVGYGRYGSYDLKVSSP